MAEAVSIRKSLRRFLDGYIASLGTKSPFGRLIQSAITDENLRRKLVTAPTQTLAEAGITLPDGLEVLVLENTDRVVHLVLPPLVAVDINPGRSDARRSDSGNVGGQGPA